jgi:hypothetical protein
VIGFREETLNQGLVLSPTPDGRGKDCLLQRSQAD